MGRNYDLDDYNEIKPRAIELDKKKYDCRPDSLVIVSASLNLICWSQGSRTKTCKQTGRRL